MLLCTLQRRLLLAEILGRFDPLAVAEYGEVGQAEVDANRLAGLGFLRNIGFDRENGVVFAAGSFADGDVVDLGEGGECAIEFQPILEFWEADALALDLNLSGQREALLMPFTFEAWKIGLAFKKPFISVVQMLQCPLLTID